MIDEFYSANLAQDALRGMRENASRGYCNGGVPPFGYRHEKVRIGGQLKSKLAIESHEAEVVRRIFQLCRQSRGVVDIASALNTQGLRTRAGNPWSKTVIYYLLKNEVYTGTLLFKPRKPASGNGEGWIRIEKAHSAIIDKDLFHQVGTLLRERSPKIIHPRVLSSDYLLSGLAYCGLCQSKLIGCSAKSGQYHYYVCQSVLKRGRVACGAKLLSRTKLETAIIEKLKHRVVTESHLTRLVELVKDELLATSSARALRQSEMVKRCAELQGRLDRLYAALETGQLSVEDIAPRIKELRSQIGEMESQRMSEVEAYSEPQMAEADIVRCVDDFKKLMWSGSFIERKSFIRSFVKRVVYPHQSDMDSGELEYTLPLVPHAKAHPERPPVEVLSLVQRGSPVL